MCVTTLMKYILFLVNLVFTLAGAALIGVGVAVLLKLSDVLNLIPININAVPISIIVLGCIIFVIAFCGCYGAITQSKCLLTTYAVVMGVLAGVSLYLAIVLFQGLSNIQNTVQGWVVDAFRHLDLFPALEFAFRCCGTTGASSYDGLVAALPASCCAGSAQCLPANAYDGCIGIVGNYFEVFGDAIAGVLIFVITAQVVAVVFSLIVCCTSGGDKHDYISYHQPTSRSR